MLIGSNRICKRLFGTERRLRVLLSGLGNVSVARLVPCVDVFRGGGVLVCTSARIRVMVGNACPIYG